MPKFLKLRQRTHGVERYTHRLMGGEIYKRAYAQISSHYESAKSYHVSATLIVIENRNNSLRNRKLDITPYAGQSWRRRIHYSEFQTLGISEDYKNKNLAIYKWLVLFFGLSLLSSFEVGTAFADEIMSTIPADYRCWKFADYIIDHYIDSGCE